MARNRYRVRKVGGRPGADDDWRVEADDEWLAAHSSNTFQRLRRRTRLLSGLGEAMSNAELGPFGGAPRRPQLKIGGRTYSVVRYVQHVYAYTVIQVDPVRCDRCGCDVAEQHRIRFVRPGAAVPIAMVRMCRSCQADAWLFHSRMPAVARARAIGRKVVL
jgi:hypothetical protein